jgi:hypothetical protein
MEIAKKPILARMTHFVRGPGLAALDTPPAAVKLPRGWGTRLVAACEQR